MTLLPEKISQPNILKIALVMIGCLFIGLFLPVIFQTFSSTSPKTAKVKTFIPQASIKTQIFLTTEAKNIGIGDEFEVSVLLDAGKRVVEAADFYLLYNPDYIEAVKINEGSLFQSYPLLSIGNGNIRISAFKSKAVTSTQAPTTVAKIYFKALQKSENLVINFDKKNTLIASGGENITGTLPELALNIK